MKVRCVHGDMNYYPVVAITVQFRGHSMDPLDFPLEQSHDEMLCHTFKQVKIINGQSVQIIVALS